MEDVHLSSLTVPTTHPDLMPARIEEAGQSIAPEWRSFMRLNSRHIEQIERAVPGGAQNIVEVLPLAPEQ
jgi:hypothetical protein